MSNQIYATFSSGIKIIIRMSKKFNSFNSAELKELNFLDIRIIILIPLEKVA